MITVPVKSTGGTYSADEFTEGVSQECQNTLLDSGVILDNTGVNLRQQKEAILRYSSAGQQYVDSGGANTYVLSSLQNTYNSDAYIDGMIVNFVVGNTSTGASTVNVNALGVKNVVDSLNNPTITGTLNFNTYTTLRYDLSNDRFVLMNPLNSGVVAEASIAQNTTILNAYNVSSVVDLGNIASTYNYKRWQINFTNPIDVGGQSNHTVSMQGWDSGVHINLTGIQTLTTTAAVITSTSEPWNGGGIAEFPDVGISFIVRKIKT